MPQVKKKVIPKYTREADLKRLRYIKNQLFSHVQTERARILDVGCGNGIISINLGEAGFEVTGVDVSQAAIDVARGHNPFENVNFEVLPAENLASFTQKYDAIVCSEVLEHLENPCTFLKDISKNLDNEGILIVTVPNGTGPRELLITRPMIYIRDRLPALLRLITGIKRVMGFTGSTIQSAAEDLDHVQFFKRRSLSNLASDSGFKIVDFSNSNFIDDVFPFSLLTRNSLRLQRFDSKVADRLPTSMAGGFFTVWKKK
jgi:2-polyprenyl-3-methyl-5-hydroxy-6-metoxy-1,4-benzoquinol methylase